MMMLVMNVFVIMMVMTMMMVLMTTMMMMRVLMIGESDEWKNVEAREKTIQNGWPFEDTLSDIN